MEAVGGAGVTDIIRIDPDHPTKKRLISVGYVYRLCIACETRVSLKCRQPISALTLSLSSSLLLVGTTDGNLHIYDVASHQLLRTISTHKGSSITHLRTMLKPPDLVGHVSLSLSVGSSSDTKDTIPVRPIVPFQRMQDPKAREAHEVMLMLPPQTTVSAVYHSLARVVRLTRCAEANRRFLLILNGRAHTRSCSFRKAG